MMSVPADSVVKRLAERPIPRLSYDFTEEPILLQGLVFRS